MDNKQKNMVYAFRLVHIANIPHILKYGFVHPNSFNADINYIPIGDDSVINTRNQRMMDNDIILGDYIPFYFGYKSPMLYVIQHGYNNVKQYDAENLVYCTIRIDDIIENNVNCVFTDGHALNHITQFYEANRLVDLNDIVNYEDVNALYWNSSDDLDLKRRKEAELLVRDELPPQFIKGFVVYNQKASAMLQHYGVQMSKIVVKPDYYF